MDDAERVSRLIGDIYDAALDRALWPSILEKIAHFVDGPAAGLVSHDIVSQAGRFHCSWGDDPHYTKLYFEKYVKLNPAAPALMLLNIGEVRAISGMMPFEEYLKSRLYLEWAKPQGYGDATVAVVEKSARTVAHLSTAHHNRDGAVSDAVLRRMELIVPHVRRAVAIGEIIDVHKVEASMLADAVDAVAAGVFLFGENGTIMHLNTSGRAMLDEGRILRRSGDTLHAVDAAANRSLHEAIAGATHDLAIGSHGIAIPLTEGEGERSIAHVLPLTAGKRRQVGSAYAASAAVFVHKAAIDRPLPLEALARHFHLTAAELRVLVAIVEVGGVPEVAPVLGIAETTVKAHLRSLFDKTGAKRQADLVKLIGEFASPFTG
jgi:DNA-binding CsgD family transcriptional regulator/PAS domain-containing protein